MKQWTLEERYRVLHGPEEIKDLYDRIQKSVYRQAYHIQPATGLSSDPNGFVKHNGVWHLFYQWCPWGAVHGLKYWYHVTSPDLVHWENAGIGLKPDRDYDNKGTHSGSAISQGKELYFFYTGNHRDENWVRTPYTCAAYMGSDGRPVKMEAPLFGPRDDYSEHQRDPKVFYVEEKKKYFIFIGAQTLDKKGCVLVYSSDRLLEGWTFAGQLKVSGYEDLGGMWECPCIERIDGKDVLVFSPQYTTLPGRGNSTNHNVYFLGQMDYDTLTFTPDGPYHHLDYGFDFYAAQIAPCTGQDEAAVLIAWIGLPDNHYPTEPEEWEGSMCLPRQLRVRDGRLYQTPAGDLAALRGEEKQMSGSACILPRACEILFERGEDKEGEDLRFRLFAGEDGNGGLLCCYDAASRCLTVDKTGLAKRFNENVGEVLTMPFETPLRKLQIFVDHSSVEMFANDGEETFTMHAYPEVDEKYLMIGEGTENVRENVRIWELGRSVTDAFVV